MKEELSEKVVPERMRMEVGIPEHVEGQEKLVVISECAGLQKRGDLDFELQKPERRLNKLVGKYGNDLSKKGNFQS